MTPTPAEYLRRIPQSQGLRTLLPGLLLGLLLMLGLARPALAELAVITLSAADAETIVELVTPLLDGDERASGKGDKLVLSASPARIAELTALVRQFDTLPATLRIFVRQGALDAGTAGGVAGDGRVVIDGGSTRADARVNVYSTRTRRDDRNAQFVTTLEGKPAFIDVGQQFPVITRQLFPTAAGVIASDGVDFQYAGAGFDVTPTLRGETVLLEIAPHLDAAPTDAYGALTRRGLSTSVRGRLGEWIPLGGSRAEAERDDRRILARTRKEADRDYTVWVRVERVN